MSILQLIHGKITNHLEVSIKKINTISSYPKIRSAVKTPAIFIENSAINPLENISDSRLKIELEFTANILLCSDENSEFNIRNLALELAAKINNQDFGLEITPAKITNISSLKFNPEFDAYETWQVVWMHEMLIGESVYFDTEFIEKTIFVGHTPKFGKDHEEEYYRLEDVTW